MSFLRGIGFGACAVCSAFFGFIVHDGLGATFMGLCCLSLAVGEWATNAVKP